ncbi:YceH family protein [Methylomagnum sp.]
MNTKLSPIEARLIGVLIEKEITTPDQYPLSLNALTNACNQKSNRDPILDLDETTVQQALDGLTKRYLVSSLSGHGVRVIKYRHRFCNTDFGELQLSKRATAILCELLLRGPQTPGELRTRCERLCKLSDVSEVENVLADLMAREEPLVEKLPREPGKRENRYAHLFGDGSQPLTGAGEAREATPSRDMAEADRERLDALEALVMELGGEVARLRKQVEAWAG